MKKRRDINGAADRFYDYLMARRMQILRYVTAALVTGLIQFFFDRLVMPEGYGTLVPFLLRMALLFPILKLWVYRERGTDIFYIGRQLMLTVMLVIIVTLVLMNLGILLGAFHILFFFLFRLLLEIAYFILFQFIIFKGPKNS